MSGRELVILLLGLAIVAVVLRGLYVALNARRGQIKLAIDKNIPQNVDLEALEMAELPGGGARVVTRSLEEVNRQNSALDIAESRARAIDLADDAEDEHIPVLMDAVELAEAAATEVDPEEPASALDSEGEIENGGVEQIFDEPQVTDPEETTEAQEEIDEEEFTSYMGEMPTIGDDWEDDEEGAVEGTEAEENYSALDVAGEQGHVAGDEHEDPDSILFDYEEDDAESAGKSDQLDSMSSVAPDYDDADEESAIEEVEDSYAEPPEDESYEEGGIDDEFLAGERNEQIDNGEREESIEEIDEEIAETESDDDIDAFSMTAGERIGGNPRTSGDSMQSSLFEEDEIESAEAESKPKKSRSLFSMFGRKSDGPREDIEDEESAVAESDAVEVESVEPFAVEPESEVATEAPYSASDDRITDIAKEQQFESEDRIVDELDQKRAASVEQESEVSHSEAEEFEHSEVLVLNVTAKEGRVFSGDDLLHILIMSGLKFGDMNIFHKRLSKDNQGAVIFSVANMLNPGTFDLNNMDEFTTLGISFFLALPTSINNLDAFEQMLGIAQDIRDALGGDLKDDHRNGMTAQTIEHYRQRIRDFELRRLKTVAARG